MAKVSLFFVFTKYFSSSIGFTLRFEIVGEEHRLKAENLGKGIIYSLWHGNLLFIGYFIYSLKNKRKGYILSSPSRDGEAISKVGQGLRFGRVMGAAKRGGVAAIIELINGNMYVAIALLIWALFVGTIDNFIKPIIVSKRAKVHTAVILIGMIGGIFFFGIIGLILGPLILAYLLIVLELYRNKKSPGLILPSPKKRKSR